MFVSFFYLLMIFFVSVSFRFVSALSCFVSVVSRFASFRFCLFRFVSVSFLVLQSHTIFRFHVVFWRKNTIFRIRCSPFWYFYCRLYFSKVLREFVKDFRSKGKRITMVLDDGLAGDNDYDTAVKSSREENDQLPDFFLIVHDKCHWSPCQKLVWLGYTWDTENGIIFCQRRENTETRKMLNLCPVPNEKRENFILC